VGATPLPGFAPFFVPEAISEIRLFVDISDQGIFSAVDSSKCSLSFVSDLAPFLRSLVNSNRAHGAYAIATLPFVSPESPDKRQHEEP
jgi:hypothetical protein